MQCLVEHRQLGTTSRPKRGYRAFSESLRYSPFPQRWVCPARLTIAVRLVLARRMSPDISRTGDTPKIRSPNRSVCNEFITVLRTSILCLVAQVCSAVISATANPASPVQHWNTIRPFKCTLVARPVVLTIKRGRHWTFTGAAARQTRNAMIASLLWPPPQVAGTGSSTSVTCPPICSKRCPSSALPRCRTKGHI
ncbi:uncharacterized protein EI97DRAFT_129284 [Westerdykella ornata]|uniref:Uncharacterized protein n=1 Tax=Westerdykella ornata TaxID=318751 RepID=A0A6A6JFN3_WESOR|nr:uncharacterized protein EI97DRAFT_129284 [Westerdykella ornata]KAF2274436.1 hypothetical protein EI97DRAFT_129284 [Westerdykella ornata]